MPPANDNATAATVLTGTSGSVTFDNTGATRQTGEPANGGNSSLGTVWFKHTPTSNGDVTFTTQSTPLPAWDSWLELFTCTDPTDFTTFTSEASDDDSGPQAGSTDPYGTSRLHATLTAGTDYYLQVAWYDDVSGPPERSGLVLSWAPYTPPPPAPTADTWTSSGTYAADTLFPGDDATVTGTDLDTVTTVTVGGVAQPFTITSPTDLVVHVNSSAVSGPIVVFNASGNDPATGSATVLYPGPWTISDPADVTVTGNGAPYAADIVTTGTQPSFDGMSRRSGAGGAAGIDVFGHTPLPAPEWDWLGNGSVMIVDASDPAFMAPVPPSYSDPTVVDFQYEAPYGTVISDPTVEFYGYMNSGVYVDDNDGKTAGDTSVDVWQADIEFRLYEGPMAGIGPSTWPTATDFAAMQLDYSKPGLEPGATSTVDSVGETDNMLTLTNPTPGWEGPLVIPWSDWDSSSGGPIRAWAITTTSVDGGPAITPPQMLVGHNGEHSTASGEHEKSLTGHVNVRATWTYRPPRTRLLYNTPPAVTLTRPLRRRQQAAPVGSAPRRRQIANRAGSLRRGPGAVP